MPDCRQHVPTVPGFCLPLSVTWPFVVVRDTSFEFAKSMNTMIAEAIYYDRYRKLTRLLSILLIPANGPTDRRMREVNHIEGMPDRNGPQDTQGETNRPHRIGP